MIQKKVCRLLLTTSMSTRDIGAQCNVAHNTAARYRGRLKEEGLTWDMIKGMSDEALNARLRNRREERKKKFVAPDFKHVHEELHRVGVTLTLLYEEYEKAAGEGRMSDREFRRRYDRYKRSIGIVMRQPLRPGEHLFVDYSGKRPSIVDPRTGEKTPVELWVGVLGASRKTFVYATRTQQLPDWIDVHVRAMEFYGAVPTFLVPDNLKSAVVSVTRREGHVINPTYQDFADHYDTIVMPTRPRKPRDKAAVEAGVLLAQRWILARLRNRTFYSLEELNAAIAELLIALNGKPMRGRGGKSRNELFEQMDRPAMKPLPKQPYEYADWKIGVVVGPDYRILWDRHYYTVPYSLISTKVDVRATVATVSIFHRNQLVATHLRSDVEDEATVDPEHQPPAHRMYSEDRFPDLIIWAEKVGPSVEMFLRQHFGIYSLGASLAASKGLKRLARDFGADRLDCACARALRMKASTVVSVRSMLIRNLENAPLLDGEAANESIAPHENVRGPASYE